MSAYDDLQNHIARLNDILNVLNILKWDSRTQMPPGGSETRGYQLATLSGLAREHFTGDATARLLDAAEAEVASEDPDSYRVRAVQQTRQYYEIVRRIPADLLSRRATLAPVSEQVWHEAKQNNDFARFAPYLQKMLDLAKEQADAIGYEEHPFDALVFEYEPSMTASKLRALFAERKAGLLPRLARIVRHDRPLEKDLWAQEYPVDKQRAFARTPPGAVLDGRDIGTVVCPDADVKLYVTATAEVRARRRLAEIEARGGAAEFGQILADIERRDARDMGRADSPLLPASDAHLLDTSEMDIETAFQTARALVEQVAATRNKG